MKNLLIGIGMTLMMSVASFAETDRVYSCEEFAKELVADTIVQVQETSDAKEEYLSDALFKLSIANAAMSADPKAGNSDTFIGLERAVDAVDAENKSRKELMDRQLKVLSQGIERLINECLK